MSVNVGEWWVVEWAGGRSFSWHRVANVVQRNGELMMGGELPGKSVVGVVPSAEMAQTHARNLRRLLDEKHESESEGCDADGSGEHGCCEDHGERYADDPGEGSGAEDGTQGDARVV